MIFKRPIIPVGISILLGEMIYLSDNPAVGIILIICSVIFIKVSNRKCGQKKCSHLLLFCCLMAGAGIGFISDRETLSERGFIGTDVVISGVITDVSETPKYFGINIDTGSRSVKVS